MDNRSIWRGVAIALVAVAAAVAIGIGGFQMGVAHALATSGSAIAGPVVPYAYGWYPWHHGFGFFPILGLLLLFLLVRRIFWWRGPWHRHGYCRHDGVPPAFDEWHRRAHSQQSSGSNSAGTSPER
jgi:MFS family permease